MSDHTTTALKMITAWNALALLGLVAAWAHSGLGKLGDAAAVAGACGLVVAVALLGVAYAEERQGKE